MRRTIFAVLFTVLSASAHAQFFSEFVEVRVTNVDAVVTDKDGNPVRGLTRSDFEIYEDGVKMEISNFLEVQDPPSGALTPAGEPQASSDPRRRNFVVFVDDAVLHPLRRNVVLQHLQQFLDSHLRLGDEVRVITWSQSLKMELEPTSDRAAIDQAMKRLAARPAFEIEEIQRYERFQKQVGELIDFHRDLLRGPGGLIPKPTLTQGIYEARDYAQWLTNRERTRIEALKTVMASMRGTTGRRIMVLLTQSLSLTPAQDAFNYIDAKRDEFMVDGAQPMQEAKQFEMPGIVTEIVNAANSSGITIYGIDGSGKDGLLNVNDASKIVRVPASGVFVQNMSFPVMGAIAEETGGMAVVGTTNWKLAFDAIANDLTTYYSLGYKGAAEKQDRLKKLDVRVKNKRYKVRSRHAVIEPSLSTEMNDAVASHLFGTVSNNELAIRASAGAATAKSEESTVIPLTITIPTEKVTLIPDGTDFTGSVSLYAAFLLRDGKVSKVARHTQSFRFPAASLPRRKELTLKLDVTTDPTTSGISVGVMDDPSRSTGFAAVKVN